MKHEPLFVLGAEVVNLLRVAHRAERADAQHLRLAAGEHARAVRAREQANLARQRTNLLQAATVRPLAHVEHAPLERRLLRLVECGGDDALFVILGVFLEYFRLDVRDLRVARVVIHAQCLVQSVSGV